MQSKDHVYMYFLKIIFIKQFDFLLTRNLVIYSIYIYIQEILKNEKYREEIKTKSEDYEKEEKLLSKESNEGHLAPPLQTQIKGHASAPPFGKEEPSAAPTSTGKTFQPGSWMPQDGKRDNQ